MRHTVKLHGVIVGHSELEHADRDIGRAWGAFRPGLGYELVQPVFRLFSQAVPLDGSPRDESRLERYFAARDALKLTLEDGAGATIPVSAVHIADYTVESGPSAIALDVLIKNDDYWASRPDSE
ncbi:MAG: hypothetical protein ABI442_17215 [Gemmatimonadaceae bacterium]